MKDAFSENDGYGWLEESASLARPHRASGQRSPVIRSGSTLSETGSTVDTILMD